MIRGTCYWALSLLVCLPLYLLGVARAQDLAANFPTRPITLVVPYPPGGSNDVFARSIAKEMAETLKQPVVVDNRAGASGTTGTLSVVRAPADGYTLVVVSSSMTTTAAVAPNAPFNPATQLAPIAMLAEGPMIVAVNNNFPAKTPKELIDAIRAKPGTYNYASSGLGSVNQFGTELLKVQAGKLFIVHIPYRGMSPAVTDLISGQTQVLMASGPSLLPMVRAGRVRAIGITSAQAHAIAPELMPMASAVPGYEFSLWWGMFAPAGTPAPVAAKLNAAVNQALAKAAIKEQFLKEGALAQQRPAAELGDIVAADMVRWKKLAAQQKIVIE